MQGFVEQLIDKITYLPVLLLALTVHELCHGVMAYKLGDSTAKYDGRLSLNPLRHIDPIGLLCMVLWRFGWAKPVMVDTRNLKTPKVDMALIAAAGPVSNFIMGFLSMLALYAVFYFTDLSGDNIVSTLLEQSCALNVSLCVFNLLPIPPLDGSKIFAVLIPDHIYRRLPSVGRYGMVILMILIFTNAIDRILGPLVETVIKFFLFLSNNIFALIVPHAF
ncbi:MAG: site-2 protease family protein [Clostridiales bacterium]|jgi:Zn-dependent protease|nr:site-2 protease family protein [Clostridiales bacterium]